MIILFILLQQYIAYARKYVHPTLSEEAAEELQVLNGVLVATWRLTSGHGAQPQYGKRVVVRR